MRLLFENEQNCGRVFDRSPETKPGIERNVTHRLRRNIAEIESDQTKSAALNEQIGGAEGLVDIPAADPK